MNAKPLTFVRPVWRLVGIGSGLTIGTFNTVEEAEQGQRRCTIRTRIVRAEVFNPTIGTTSERAVRLPY